MLEIKDLHVQFHTSDHEAVRGIDLTVQRRRDRGAGGRVRQRQDRYRHDDVRPAAAGAGVDSGGRSCWTGGIC